MINENWITLNFTILILQYFLDAYNELLQYSYQIRKFEKLYNPYNEKPFDSLLLVFSYQKRRITAPNKELTILRVRPQRYFPIDKKTSQSSNSKPSPSIAISHWCPLSGHCGFSSSLREKALVETHKKCSALS